MKILNRLVESLKSIIIRKLNGLDYVKKGKIVFSNFNGRGFGDNPKYIALEILRQNLPMDLVWLVNEMDEYVPAGVRKVKFGSRKMEYELATAQVIVNNVKNDLPYRKKKTQFYLQTWHGGFPLKFIEAEIEERLSPRYVEDSKRDSTKIDLMLASCSVDAHIMRNFFWYCGEIMTQGIPRNDVYFEKDTSAIVKRVRMSLNIPADLKIALYAPTFREGNDIFAYGLDTTKVLQSLETLTKEKWAVIIRLHPNVSCLSSLFRYTDQIIDGSAYPDPQELGVTSDLLITDYSSMMYDFTLMKKPVFLFANDFDAYKKERGLRPLFDELPFPFSQTNEALSKAILDFDESEYQKRIGKYWSESVQVYDNGHASSAVVDRIKEAVYKKNDLKVREVLYSFHS